MTNAVCKSYNESWITVQTCRLKAVSRNVTKLNIVANLLHPVYDLGVQAQIYKKANGYKPWLMKFDVDICRFLKRAYNPAAIFIFKLFKEFTNFNHSCPYKVSRNIICQRLSIKILLNLGYTNYRRIVPSIGCTAAHYTNWRLYVVHDLDFR